MARQPVLDWLNGDIAALRAAYAASRHKPVPAGASWMAIERVQEPLRVLRHQPKKLSTGEAVIVYFHGGGWIVGSPETHLDITTALCERSGLELLSVDYRLAPEQPAPAPVADGLSVVDYILSTQPAGQCQRSIFLCGDSAGGSIALAVERSVSKQSKDRIAGVCSIYGAFGLFDTASLKSFGNRDDGLDRECLMRYWMLAHGRDQVSPYALESLSCFSPVPVYLMAAAKDAVRDDTMLLAGRLQRYRRDVTLDVVDDETHGFMHNAGSSASASLSLGRLTAWMGGHLR